MKNKENFKNLGFAHLLKVSREVYLRTILIFSLTLILLARLIAINVNASIADAPMHLCDEDMSF